MSTCQRGDCQWCAELRESDDADQLRTELAEANAKIARVEAVISDLAQRECPMDAFNNDEIFGWQSAELNASVELRDALKGA